jgi:hypothetical protein
MKKIIIFICLNLLFSINAFARSATDYSFFLHHGDNDSDHYSSIGVEVLQHKFNSYLGIAANSSIGYAQVTDTFDDQHGFIAWEAGIKVGYFSNFSLYAEFGVDLLEFAFSDRSDDDDNYSHNHSTNHTDFENDNFDHKYTDNNIDGYVGIGSSIMIEQIKITGFVRFREISGYNWQAENITFSGIELAVVF